ncbi:hypothetical protein H7171_00310 [Candidatus Saccharibacteria bacterium]|nr:hypothetical protein [Candidatus Saccharibacteria bacterium]
MSNRIEIGYDESKGHQKIPAIVHVMESLHAPISPRSRSTPSQRHGASLANANPMARPAPVKTFFRAKRSSSEDYSPKQPARLSRPLALSSIDSDMSPDSTSAIAWPFLIITPQPFARPAHPKQQRSRVLHRLSVRRQLTNNI